MPNLKIMANDVSFMTVIAHASIGVANASPVSTATGSAASTQGDFTAPKAAITAMKTAQFITSRIVVNSRCPWNRSAGRSGVDTAA